MVRETKAVARASTCSRRTPSSPVTSTSMRRGRRVAELEEQLQNHDTRLAEADVAAIRGELKKALARIALSTVGG